MVEEKVVEKYAVCGGTAALIYDTETLRTYDIDVFVFLPRTCFSLDLSPIYAWARNRGYGVDAEHLIIHSVPVQVLVAGEGLELEALETANCQSRISGFALRQSRRAQSHPARSGFAGTRFR